MNRPVVLLDGMNQVFRAHFAHQELTTPTGLPTGAVYGFLNTLLTVQKHFSPNLPDIVVVWEGDTTTGTMGTAPLPTWRKVLAKSIYKSNRVPNEETARALSQIPKIVEILRAMRFLQVQVPQLEADDVIGVAAATLRLDKSASHVYIVSGDRDYYQCIEAGRVEVLHPKLGKTIRVDAHTVLKENGVTVKDWAKFKALAGDATDNYKAIKGIGPKGALKLLGAGIDPSISTWKALPKAVQDAHPQLREHWEKVHLCYRLALIPRTWSHNEFPLDSRPVLKNVLKDIVLRRRRRMTEPELRQAFAAVTKIFGELAFVSLLPLRSSFFFGVKVLK